LAGNHFDVRFSDPETRFPRNSGTKGIGANFAPAAFVLTVPTPTPKGKNVTNSVAGVALQHEFGIIQTVLADPSPSQRGVMDELCQRHG
jgi:hypothetical protein